MQDWHFFTLIGIVLIIAEAFTPTFIFLPIGIASLITALSAVFIDSLAIELLIFFFSILLVWYGLQKSELKMRLMSDKSTVHSGTKGMIGKEVLVTEKIDPSTFKGAIKLYSDVWKASSNNNMIIEKGQKVKITGVEGNTVLVELLVNS